MPKVRWPSWGWGRACLTPEPRLLFPKLQPLGMSSLILEGQPTWLQPPRSHLARTRVTDGAAGAEALGTSPPGPPVGGAAAPEEAHEKASRG